LPDSSAVQFSSSHWSGGKCCIVVTLSPYRSLQYDHPPPFRTGRSAGSSQASYLAHLQSSAVFFIQLKWRELLHCCEVQSVALVTAFQLNHNEPIAEQHADQSVLARPTKDPDKTRDQRLTHKIRDQSSRDQRYGNITCRDQSPRRETRDQRTDNLTRDVAQQRFILDFVPECSCT